MVPMRLLVLLSFLVVLAPGAGAQDESGLEYWISEAVHDTLAAQIEAIHAERPAANVYLIWRVYSDAERGLTVAELGEGCVERRVATAGRYLRLRGERIPIIPSDDNTYAVSGWASNPFDPSGPQRPMRCYNIVEFAFTVRFDPQGQIVEAGREGVLTED